MVQETSQPLSALLYSGCGNSLFLQLIYRPVFNAS